MKRSAPPKRYASLRRGAAPVRKTRVKKINRKRMKRLREEQFGITSGYRKHVIEQPCAACGTYHPEYGSQPAHVGRTRGAGGKADAVLSLCQSCHSWEHEDSAGFGEAFRERHGVLPQEMAECRFEVYHRERQG